MKTAVRDGDVAPASNSRENIIKRGAEWRSRERLCAADFCIWCVIMTGLDGQAETVLQLKGYSLCHCSDYMLAADLRPLKCPWAGCWPFTCFHCEDGFWKHSMRLRFFIFYFFFRVGHTIHNNHADCHPEFSSAVQEKFAKDLVLWQQR